MQRTFSGEKINLQQKVLKAWDINMQRKKNSNPYLAPYVKIISKWFKPKCETYNYKTTRKKKTGIKYT